MRFLRLTPALLLTSVLAACGPLLLAQKKDAKKGGLDEPPVLISMGKAGWKNLAELERFAELGDPQALFELADRRMTGDEVARDYTEARRLFERAAEAGVADAWFRLGKIHHDGLGVPRDQAKGFQLYAEAARRGVPEAQHNVGAMLVSARGVRRDYIEGLAWLIVATKSGAVSMAEQQVRERLARRPADIEKAEARAKELWAALKDPEAAVTPHASTVSSADSAAAAGRPPITAPAREAPPKVDVKAPARTPPPKLEFEVPKVVPPRPTVAPPKPEPGQ